ncbi:uncharacterized protein N7498_005700 [Penicillium cinerascens]|uniref:Uncharacterized protein n=1 Tax=Penicillium cinerascens TaxID=70096 RepID=A0A9W9MNX7_9EURO|nr:uncharacterized protein N7498_005700 [Penicillium cinerascens]KAJ5204821.1 hypothetical protein N7498_005700 [Penicillium cinerascens]
MKFTAAIITSLLATSAVAFDKWQPWGKRDYSCVNVYQGVPDYSTVTVGQTVHLRFNRKPTSHCADPLNQYPGDKYSVWLYNNPVRDGDTINFDKRIQIASGIAESAGVVDVKIPSDLPHVKDDSVWYLRIDTSLTTAPQMPTIYNAAGPFTITA